MGIIQMSQMSLWIINNFKCIYNISNVNRRQHLNLFVVCKSLMFVFIEVIPLFNNIAQLKNFAMHFTHLFQTIFKPILIKLYISNICFIYLKLNLHLTQYHSNIWPEAAPSLLFQTSGAYTPMIQDCLVEWLE